MRKVRKLSIARKFVGAASFFLLASPVAAGPDDVSKWLMNDPVSMMDFGIHRIEQALQMATYSSDPTKRVGGNAFFSFEENKIIVFELFLGHDGEDEKTCADWVAAVRLVANVRNGKPTFRTTSAFGYMFTHAGFVRSSEPEDFSASVDKLIELQCVVSEKVKISAPLLGTTYMLERLPE